MSGDEDTGPGGYASPPCLAHEIDPTYFDPAAVDPQQAADVARWRKAERPRLLEERAALPVAAREAAPAGATSYSSSAPAEASGTLASDEALAALREKLTGN